MSEAKRVLIWCAVSSKVQASDDKISLSLQEKLGREFAASIGGVVVDVLKVPGHSRGDDDIIAMLEEHASKNCFAYHDLRKLWYSKGFDVLWAHTDDRLARSTTGITWVLTNTIKNGMSVYLDQPRSWITQEDAKFKTLMSAMSAGESVKAFVTKSQATKDDRTSQGIHSTGRLPFGLTRREGDCITIPDERYRAIFDDVAALVLARTDWDWLSDKMFEVYGHINPKTGRKFGSKFWYTWFHNPWVWGHGARNFRERERVIADYVYDDAAPVPGNVKLWRNVSVPVYTGDLAAQLKAELKRRRNFVGGKAQAGKTHQFTGLVLCGQCGYTLTTHSDRTRGDPIYLVCRTGINEATRHLPRCQYKYVRIDHVQAYINARLEHMLETGVPTLIDSPQEDVQTRLDTLATEHATLDAEIDRLANRLAFVDDSVVGAVNAQINQRAARRKAIDTERAQLQGKLAAQDTRARDTSFAFLQGIGLPAFWKLPEAEINQHLHAIFGNVRLLTGIREIAALTFQPEGSAYQKRPTRQVFPKTKRTVHPNARKPRA